MSNLRTFWLVLWICLVSVGMVLADPPIPKDCLYKPTFLMLDDSWTAGTAFLVRLPGQQDLFLITANHLFGPDAGLKAQMPPDDIASLVTGVAALSMQDIHQAFWFPTFIKIADANSADNRIYSKDIAVFKRPDIPELQVLDFASEMPKKGDKVWLFARQRGDDTPALIPGVVEQADADKLTYIFDSSDFRLAGTSGAPVLNEAGKVVGMNLAGGPLADKRYKGWANPVVSMKAEISAALGQH